MLDVEESMLDVAADERRETPRAVSVRRTGDSCDDLEEYPAVETVEGPGCQACLDAGVRWVALRQCLSCGDVGCCDSSPLQHATAHFHETDAPGHPVRGAGRELALVLRAPHDGIAHLLAQERLLVAGRAGESEHRISWVWGRL